VVAPAKPWLIYKRLHKRSIFQLRWTFKRADVLAFRLRENAFGTVQVRG
jgi:hypothetical protein